MYFHSWSDFLNMGGYGFYVWLAYGLSFLTIAVLVIQNYVTKKALFNEIKRDLQRESREAKQSKGAKL